jgi:23S rRNA pseudouridine1911/1915/1917 synthase
MNSPDSAVYIQVLANRLDKAIGESTGLSRSYVQTLIEHGYVLVNGQPMRKTSHTVSAGEVYITQGVIKGEKGYLPTKLSADHQPLDILFEDDSMLVVNKPAGLIVHPTSAISQTSLVQQALSHAPNMALALYDPTSPISYLRPGVVHRLDSDTTGVVVFAKTRTSMLALSQQFQRRTVKKQYRALLNGHVQTQELRHALYRPTGSRRMEVSKRGEGRQAITAIELRKTYSVKLGAVSDVQCSIYTGRTHQIRVQSSHIGHPVLGDSLYGNAESQTITAALGVKRQMLHAWQLGIQHPLSGRLLLFEAPLAEDFQTVLTNISLADSLE